MDNLLQSFEPVSLVVQTVPHKNNKIVFQLNAIPCSGHIAGNEQRSDFLRLTWDIYDSSTAGYLGRVYQDDSSVTQDFLWVSSTVIANNKNFSIILYPSMPYFFNTDKSIITAKVDLESFANGFYSFTGILTIGAPNDDAYISNNFSYREYPGPTGTWFHNKHFRWGKNNCSLLLPTCGADRIIISVHGFFSVNFKVRVESFVTQSFRKSEFHSLRQEEVYEFELSNCYGDFFEMEFVALEALPKEQFDLRQLFAAIHKVRLDYFYDSPPHSPRLSNALLGASTKSLAPVIEQLSSINDFKDSYINNCADVILLVSRSFVGRLSKLQENHSIELSCLFGAYLLFLSRGLSVSVQCIDEFTPIENRTYVVPYQKLVENDIESLLRISTFKCQLIIMSSYYLARYPTFTRLFAGLVWTGHTELIHLFNLKSSGALSGVMQNSFFNPIPIITTHANRHDSVEFLDTQFLEDMHTAFTHSSLLSQYTFYRAKVFSSSPILWHDFYSYGLASIQEWLSLVISNLVPSYTFKLIADDPLCITCVSRHGDKFHIKIDAFCYPFRPAGSGIARGYSAAGYKQGLISANEELYSFALEVIGLGATSAISLSCGKELNIERNSGIDNILCTNFLSGDSIVLNCGQNIG